jgi:hypothetical protein
MLPAPSEDGLADLAWYVWSSTLSKLVLCGSISINDNLFLLFFLQIMKKLKEKVFDIIGDCKA